MKKKVIVAMSGGVDSSAAAALLIEQGYDVVGITLNVWPKEDGGLACSRTCCSITDVDDARHVCAKLGIPHYVLNMQETFRKDVINYFFDEYMKGRTPNPCIACNAHVKFQAMLHKTKELGADYMATGHYGSIVKTPEGELALKRSKDCHKDQTYVLYMLGQEQLSHLLLPCGGYTKPEIRKIAEKYGLPNFSKPDSQDLCFVGPEGYSGFIKNNCEKLARPGKIVKADGTLIGEHDGIYNFTVGQHKGLGKFSQERFFVTGIDADTATVYVGMNDDLFKDSMSVCNLSYMLKSKMTNGARVGVKIRYSAKEAPATLYIDGDTAKVKFDEPQRAITPGQAAVFYIDDTVIGGGVITGTL
jgi:tRNA-specific 2-thiouridylase